MKTAEEKAREASNDYGIDDIQHRTMFASGYLQGYSEAMRWRDPKEELPEEGGCDFCRDEHGYTIGNMYVCDKCGRQVS